MKSKILIQFDPDPQASTFDSIVAIDAGVDHLLVQSGVEPVELEALVHGAMFTRGGDDLRRTALFFGGSNVDQTEALVTAAKECFFGPVRVSWMSDPNGSNTTAAAAVLAVQRELDLNGKTVTILAGTGPVGVRIAQILSGPADLSRLTLRICSRKLERAQSVCDRLSQSFGSALDERAVKLTTTETNSSDQALQAVAGAEVVFAAGAAGIELVDARWQEVESVQAVVDLNAVPPAGIADVEVTENGVQQNGVVRFGAIGVGGLKMKIHKAAVAQLFESNDQELDTDQIYQIGKSIQVS